MEFLKTIFSKKYLVDIRFYIVLFGIIRLVGITEPPLEHSHNWRQCTGIMVARNYYETDNNLFYPRVDESEGKTGIVGMEFPVINYSMYLISEVFGFHDWYGRLINLIVSSFGIWFFFLIIRRFFSERHAFYSSLVLLSSIWFMFSRKTMHDTFCIALVLGGIWYGLKYIFDNNKKALFFAVILLALGSLSKISAIYLIVVMALPILNPSIRWSRKAIFFMAMLPVAFVVWYWYFVWNPHLSSEFERWYNIGKPLAEGWNDTRNNLGLIAERFYFDGLKSYFGLAAALTGVFFLIKMKEKAALWVISLLTIVFVMYIIKSGTFFSMHDHYIIPYAPVLAFMAGFGVSQLKGKYATIVIAIILFEGVLNQQHDLLKRRDRYKLTIENTFDSFSNKSDLIVVNGDGNPQELYFSHRKGWTISNQQATDTTFLKSIKEKGCKYLYINKHNFSGTIQLQNIKMFENNDYVIFTLLE